jgi:uncharacterized membrane protein
MTAALAILLLVNAVFNVAVWPTFYKRIARDPRARDESGKPTRFLLVHTVIIGTALVLAAVSAVVGVIGLVVG